jgi:hypothetical protein
MCVEVPSPFAQLQGQLEAVTSGRPGAPPNGPAYSADRSTGEGMTEFEALSHRWAQTPRRGGAPPWPSRASRGRPEPYGPPSRLPAARACDGTCVAVGRSTPPCRGHPAPCGRSTELAGGPRRWCCRDCKGRDLGHDRNAVSSWQAAHAAVAPRAVRRIARQRGHAQATFGTRVISTFVSSASASTELTNVVGPTVTPFHSASVRHRTMRA